uniref:Uncharacterized protein n=1 Tax=Nelumbo nucifera TaxID=4432 RepID=A0A822YLS0_NELNU|nr:TPA_asm: hypothetical protein HUJ06_011382 [Nelumbo nucifera]
MNTLVRERRLEDIAEGAVMQIWRLEVVLDIAARCTDANPDAHPSMSEVLQILEVMSPCPREFLRVSFRLLLKENDSGIWASFPSFGACIFVLQSKDDGTIEISEASSEEIAAEKLEKSMRRHCPTNQRKEKFNYSCHNSFSRAVKPPKNVSLLVSPRVGLLDKITNIKIE